MADRLPIDSIEMDETEGITAASAALAAQKVEAALNTRIQPKGNEPAAGAGQMYIESDSDDYLLPHTHVHSSTQVYHDLGEGTAAGSPILIEISQPRAPAPAQLSLTHRKVMLARSLMLSRIGDFRNGSVAGINRTILKSPTSGGSGAVSDEQGSAAPEPDVAAIGAVQGSG